MRSEETYTIEQFIDSTSSSKVTYETLSLIEQFNDIILLSYNVLNDYIDELVDLAVTVVLSEEEYNKYVYKPKLLAHDVYGSGELYFILMILNNICNVKEFKSKKIKMLKVDDLEKVTSSIYNSERYTLELNRNKMM